MPRNSRQWGILVVALAVTHGVGVVGSFFTIGSLGSWYAFIEKPDFVPPNWLFMPIWLVLYTLMGLAAYLVARESLWRADVRLGIRWYAVQLVLNMAWSLLFFGFRNPLYGLIDIPLLLLSSILTTWYFFRVSSVSGILMMPYICWLLFAGVLNYVIWILN